MQLPVPRPRPRTLLCGAAMVAVSLPFAAAGLSLWSTTTGGADPATLQRLASAGIDDPEASRVVLGGTAALLLGASAWTAALGIGVAARRSGARMAGILTFLLFALIAVPHGVGGMLLDPRPAGAGQALAVGTVNATVLWLLASGTVADDIARAAFYRRRRRQRPTGADDGRGPGRGGRPEPPILAA